MRNHLFDIGYTRSFKFEVKTIVVGNLATGGTGKTPMIEYLIKLLRKNQKIATLSRGYGRKTSGFIIADELQTSNTIGDEPMQFYLKFREDINVCVGEERAMAIPEILYHFEDTKLILLDDAFQHRQVIAGLNILLTDYQNLFYHDYPLPMGNLRESRFGAQRADVLVVTKCPADISEEKMSEVEASCSKYLKRGTPVCFSSITYLEPQPVFDNNSKSFTNNVILFSGIGKSSYLEQHVKARFNLVKAIKFADHYSYSEKDMLKIKYQFDNMPGQDLSLMTTEKDMVKIKELSVDPSILELPLYYLPIEIQFIKGKEDFDRMMFNYVSSDSF